MGGRIPPGYTFERWVVRDHDEVSVTQTCTTNEEFGPPCSVKYMPCPDGEYSYHWSYCLDPNGKKDEQGFPASCKTCRGKGYVERA
jgi:hypothetical protein